MRQVLWSVGGVTKFEVQSLACDVLFVDIQLVLVGSQCWLMRQVRKWRLMMPGHQIVSLGMKRRAASVRRNSLPAGTASQSAVQPGASTRSPWKLQLEPRPA